MEIIADTNYLAVIAAAIASMLAGQIWYSNYVFGRVWMRAMEPGAKEAEQKGTGTKYILATAGAILTSFVVAQIVYNLNVNDAGGAFWTAFWIWAGFIVPVSALSVLWEGKRVTVYAINVFYQFFSLLIMAMILSFWI